MELFLRSDAGVLHPASLASFTIAETTVQRTGFSGQMTSTTTRTITDPVNRGSGAALPSGTYELGYINKSGHFTSVI